MPKFLCPATLLVVFLVLLLPLMLTVYRHIFIYLLCTKIWVIVLFILLQLKIAQQKNPPTFEMGHLDTNFFGLICCDFMYVVLFHLIKTLKNNLFHFTTKGWLKVPQGLKYNVHPPPLTFKNYPEIGVLKLFNKRFVPWLLAIDPFCHFTFKTGSPPQKKKLLGVII